MRIIRSYFYLELDNTIAAEAKCQLTSLHIAAWNYDPTGRERHVEWQYGTRDHQFTAAADADAVKKSGKQT